MLVYLTFHTETDYYRMLKIVKDSVFMGILALNTKVKKLVKKKVFVKQKRCLKKWPLL
jgi:hypothetical protein